MEVVIRRLLEADAQALWDLRLTALRSAPEAFGESVDEHLQMPVETLARRLGSGGDENFVLGAFTGPDLKGMVGFYRDTRPKRRQRGWIWGMYVAEAWRGQGIAERLVCETIQRADAIPGLHTVILGVTANQLAARRLYERIGFVAFGVEPHALQVDGVMVDECHMVLRLRGAHGAKL